MFCKDCGKENAPGAAFCTGCGAALAPTQQYAPPQQAAKPVRKKNAPAIALGVLSLALALALVLSLTGVLGTVAGAAGVASKSFATPEDAINYFADCLAKGDFHGALAACAVDEMARGFDYKAYVERIRTILPVATSFIPSEYEQYIEFNKVRLTQQIMTQMVCFTISLNLPEGYGGIVNGTTIALQGEEFPDDLMDVFDPSSISGLEVVDIAKAGMHDKEVNRQNQKKMAKPFGADDEQFRTVLYKCGGNYYIGGFTVMEYGGRWLIQNMSDPLAGIPALGTPLRVSGEEEFRELLG
jgi:hypothetical protein